MANPYGYVPYYQYQNYPAQALQQPQQQPQQIQSGGFVSVHSETEARNYPVAPGTSIMFRDENAPYIYNKTMGYSQLDRPTFDKYRLVKEDVQEPQTNHASQDAQIGVKNEQGMDLSIYALKSEIEPILDEIKALKKELEKKTTNTRKKEVTENE